MSRTFRFLSVMLCITAISNPAGAAFPAIAPIEPHCSPDDPHAGPGYESPAFFETLPGGSLPPAEDTETVRAQATGPIAPAAGQPSGALSDRIIFTSGGHGWTASGSSWSLQRGVLLEMNEDYGNVDQMNLFATYCFNAGATVVPMRPIGNQTNEVVLDNDDAGVTFSGTWNNSSSTIFYGSAGDLPYRFASLAATETATATYAPNLPAAGFYPVYTWVRHGPDRTSQLYRIRHTGGESLVRVPHHMVGNGWVYLGTYYFNAGSNAASGAVVISNLQPSPNVGSVIIADAIRFGNGMGNFDRGFGKSTYPCEEECSRYWVQRSLGQGQAATLYDPDLPGVTTDDIDDNVGAPPRMAREMNSTDVVSSIFKRLLISFHSNAAGGRGVVGLWNDNTLFPNTGTPNQFRLAQLIGQEINDDLTGSLTPPLELAWFDRDANVTFRRTDFAFGEIRNDTLGGEMDATIVEVAFHDHDSDAKLLRDPKARNWVARATYQAAVRYMNEFDGVPLVFLPEPPGNVRAVASGSNVVVAWTAPVAQSGSGPASGYVLYQSTNGYGFGNSIALGNVTSFTLTNLLAGRDYFFRVAATNSGGQSMPSETVACRLASSLSTPRALIVNAFDRFDRFTNLRQTPSSENYRPPGHNGNTGTMERVLPRAVNAFDYVVSYAKALNAAGWVFDSCQNEAVINNQVLLGNYPVVIWACGNESMAGETFNSTEQSRLTTYLAAGGGLFASGTDIANDLDGVSGPTTADRNFLRNQLHASYTNDNAASYTVTAAGGGIFTGRANGTVDNGSSGIYWVPTPDVLGAFGPGASPALNYSGGTGGAAAIQYDGSAGGGRVVLFGFPFETITDATRRNQYLSDILAFLSLQAGTNLAPTVLSHPQSQPVVINSNATLMVVASGTPPLSYQWRHNGVNLAGATQSSYTRANAQFAHSGNYDVVVSNAYNEVTSHVALVSVTLPPVLQTVWLDNFDADTASNWAMSRSSTDCRLAFNYNYAPYGIPSAPNSTNGTTRGLKFEANFSLGLAAAINVSPIGRSFGGDYRLRFDLWINANGPFPAGGNGSTQHGTAGIGTAGGRVQWTGAGSTADGFWFAADGEGQAIDSAPDFRALSGTTLHSAASGVYAGGTEATIGRCSHPYYTATFPGGQTAPAVQAQSGALAVGTIGFAWRDVIVSKTGSTVEWFIDGLKIASIGNASLTASNIFIGYWDSFNSLSSNTNLSFGMFDNVRVEQYVAYVPPYFTSQPESKTVIAGSNAVFSAAAGGSTNLTYQWRFAGTNIAGATQSAYTRATARTIDAGNYAVVVANPYGSVTSSVAALTVLVPPFIVTQPQAQSRKTGTNVTFTVEASGTAPLAYLWRFNGDAIAGATGSSYTRTNLMVSHSGNYSVVITNAAGEVTSTNALLVVTEPAPFQFTSAALLGGDQLKLVLTGEPGTSVTLWRSEDLTNWVALTNLSNPSGTLEFVDPISLDATQRFYRAEFDP